MPRKTKFLREKIQMKLETLVGGTQSEELHKFYKEGDGRLLGLASIFRIDLLATVAQL